MIIVLCVIWCYYEYGASAVMMILVIIHVMNDNIYVYIYRVIDFACAVQVRVLLVSFGLFALLLVCLQVFLLPL